MIYNNSFNRNVAPIIINGKRYGRNPLPEDFPDTDKILFDDEKTETALLRIPRQHARTNTPYEKGFEGLDDVECYRLHIFSQVGDPYNTRRDTYIILELPSGLMVPIILYWNGGVDFDPEGRKYINREYDELDRRIIRGFCIRYRNSLIYASSYEDTSALFNILIKKKAKEFNIREIPFSLTRKNRVDEQIADSKLFVGVNSQITSTIIKMKKIKA